ncbi:hypothetical protein [Actinophytocola sp.]|uniref:hypothetical protein n=1 Tax=Actinophytocola sp. TaxID=1872138 RepID=UPI003D6BCCA9
MAPAADGCATDVDAIIVPNARPAPAVDHAMELAAALGSALVVLCSKRSSADAVTAVARDRNIELIAVDVGKIGGDIFPRFETSTLLSGTRFEVRADTSFKRNLGLLLSQAIGWQRVVFLDDDIRIPDPEDLRVAAGLTDSHAAVGLCLEGNPDHSVVCHAYREAGGAQDMFVGGGALAVGVRAMTSFFPKIYNEDWFFLVGDDGALLPITSVGTAFQGAYDPYADNRRARTEELGDCLAEGLFWLLDNGRSAADADVGFWRRALERRADFITDVVSMVRRSCDDPSRRSRMLSSLKAARGQCLLIEPELCVRFLTAWRSDRTAWSDYVQARCVIDLGREYGSRFDPEKVLASLGLTHASTVMRRPRPDS